MCPLRITRLCPRASCFFSTCLYTVSALTAISWRNFAEAVHGKVLILSCLYCLSAEGHQTYVFQGFSVSDIINLKEGM